ncbi:helix-turn-helix domain-containing protein [Streptomyces roseoverticillatus]|uniref:helix-turn-helix domain-containing protein n=1 Tax=Streptomyces roseoverticillatus TaxID=66429 RepID=UPI001F28263E|nr:helix-turn-helix transcriptional regulator [Streptomyces roseoverticillatus]MCF3103912.1 helix-turn-helix domain-containing protein [Streptomyces roseoverticillatus]
MADATPTLLRRRLGTILKTMRTRAGLNLADAAKRLDLYGAPSLSKIENGKHRPPVLEKFFAVYGVEDADRIAETQEIAKLANSSRQHALYTQYRDVIRSPFADFMELEEIAARTDVYGALVIPGLLQTVDYAHAVIEGSSVWKTTREVRAFAELRMKRQGILVHNSEAGRPPLALRCVLDEAALRREVGGPGVLRGQLKHLLAVSMQPNIELQVLPFAAGAHTGINGAYTVFNFHVGEPVVAVEPLAKSIYLEEDAHVVRYAIAFEHLQAQALDTEMSRDFIRRIAKETQ